MFRQVYGHRVRLIADAMIVRGICLAAGEDVDVKRLFEYNDSGEFLEQWLVQNDERLIRAVMESKSDKGRAMFACLLERRLHKRIARIDLRSEIKDLLTRDHISSLKGDDWTKVEALIADELNIGPLKAEPWKLIANLVTAAKPGLGGNELGWTRLPFSY